MTPPLRSILFCSLLALPLAFAACSGSGDDTGDDDSSTPAGDDDAPGIAFDGLSEGGTVSQRQTVKVSAEGATSLVFTAPPQLAGKDSDTAPDRLVALWDTTLEMNGAAQISVTATFADGQTRSRTLNVTRSNPGAALAGRNYQDGDFVRNGAPLLVQVQASAFGATPTLKGLQVSSLSGGGLTPTLPQDCTKNTDGTFTCNLGNPAEGSIDVVLNAVNEEGALSEPLILRLEVLRNDLISVYLPYDFEVSPDGKTGLLLTSNPADPSSMRLEFIDLKDPLNPTRFPEIVSLKTGITSGQTAAGNILVPEQGDKAYVIFPSNKFYAVTISTRTLSGDVNLNTPVRPDTGAGIGHLNRSPYASITPDGKFVFAITTATPALIMIDTTALDQVDGDPKAPAAQGFTFPVTNSTGFGYMVPHPNSQYLYLVNNFGNDLNAGSADLAVFNITTRTFTDFNTAPNAVGSQPLSLETATSNYRVAQQPGITPNASALIVPVCDKTSGVTKAKILTLADPSKPTKGPDVDLSAVTWGTVAAVSGNSRYALFATQQAGGDPAAVYDLSSSVLVSATFANGAMDGVFSADGGTLVTESSQYTVRQIGVLELGGSSAVEDLDVPGAAGLVPPATSNDMRGNLLVRGGNYVYQLYAAYIPDGTGNNVASGTSLSVYDVTAGSFIFPNPIGG